MKYQGTDISAHPGDAVRAICYGPQEWSVLKVDEQDSTVLAKSSTSESELWIDVSAITFIRRDLLPKPETRTHDTGALRSTDADDVAYHCMPLLGLRRVAQTACEGAKKYSPYNWAKGFKASVLMNHATDHLVKWGAGDRTEDHLAHAAWNLMALMHFEEQGRNDLMDCEPKGASNAE